MASPFIIGNFNGWVFDASENDPPETRFWAGVTDNLFEWAGYGPPIHATSPLLTGGFTPGDLISIQWAASYTGIAYVKCLSSTGATLADASVALIGGAGSSTTTLGMPDGTVRVRLDFETDGEWSVVSISAMDIPGLVADGDGMETLLNGIPPEWTFSTTAPDAGGLSFTHTLGTDSGDGGGSIEVATTSGGSGWLLVDTPSISLGKLYSFRVKTGAPDWPGAVSCYALLSGGGASYLAGMSSNNIDGEWGSVGFRAVNDMIGLRIDIGGPPGSIYLDSFDLPRMAFTEHATADLLVTLAPSLVGFGGANAAIAAPASPSLAGFGGANAAIAALTPSLYAAGHDSTGENAFVHSVPKPALSAHGGANARLVCPKPTLSASATGTGWASAAIEVPVAALAATGTVSGTANAHLSALTATLIGYSGAVCSITLTSGVTISASGTSGGIGRAALTCPLFELVAAGTAQNHGSANLLIPAPRLGATARAWIVAPGVQLTAIGSAVVAVSHEAYSINLTHAPGNPAPVDEVTRYTNFPFTHVVRHQNSYYGANSTGLYLLEGTTDDGEPIPWALKTAMDDFDSPLKKTIDSAYFGGRFGPASTVQLHAGERAPNTYSYDTPKDALAQNHRQKFGRGVKERYYALGASGTGVLEIDTIELEVRNTTRKV